MVLPSKPWDRRPSDASTDCYHASSASTTEEVFWCLKGLRRLPPGRAPLARPSFETLAAVIHWFIIQVLHGNTALQHVSLLAGRAFTGSAYCQARANLPLRINQAILRTLIKALVPNTYTGGLWLGHHRTFLVDGSSFSMPDTPKLQAHFQAVDRHPTKTHALASHGFRTEGRAKGGPGAPGTGRFSVAQVLRIDQL